MRTDCNEEVEKIVENTRMGRKPLLEKGFEIEQIVKAYEEESSTRRAAEKLGISRTSLIKYLRLAGKVCPLGRAPDPTQWQSRHPSPVARWVKEQTEPLPRSVVKLVELSGFTKDQIMYYLKRRLRAARAYIASLGDLRELRNCSLVDLKGRRVPAGMIGQYELKIDRYTLIITINIVLKFGGKTVCKLAFPRYVELFQEMPPK